MSHIFCLQSESLCMAHVVGFPYINQIAQSQNDETETVVALLLPRILKQKRSMKANR